MKINVLKSISLIFLYSIISGIMIMFFKFAIPYKAVFIFFVTLLVLFVSYATTAVKFKNSKKLIGFVVNLSIFLLILIICLFFKNTFDLEKIIATILIILLGGASNPDFGRNYYKRQKNNLVDIFIDNFNIDFKLQTNTSV